MIKMPWQVERNRQVYSDEAWGVTSSGLHVPRNVIPKPRPKAMDFFSGAGGMSLGLMQGGFEVVAAFENDVAATLTYTLNLGAYPMKFHFATPQDEDRLERFFEKALQGKKNSLGDAVYVNATSGSGFLRQHPEIPGVSHLFFGDVRKWTGEQVLDIVDMKRGELDLIAGGPPCQGFSIAGKRDVMDPRNSLIFEFARFIVDIHPRTMVMEEVPEILNMVTPEGVPVIDAFISILVKGDYGTYNALKKSLTDMKNVRGAIRKNGDPPKRRRKNQTSEPEAAAPVVEEQAQMSLFG